MFTRIEFAVCEGHIRGNSPPGTETDANTRDDGAVVFRHRQTAEGRQLVINAVDSAALSKFRFSIAATGCGAVAASRSFKTQVGRALHQSDAGKGLGRGVDGAIRFLHADFQIVAVGGYRQVINFKCSRRHVLLIQGVAILFDGNHGIGIGGAANHRGESAFAAGEHIVIRGNVNTAELDAVEDLSPRAGFAGQKLGFECLDVVLYPGGNILPPFTTIATGPGPVIS
ncbi:Uncharacterised protein [Kluyvera cryocrescens]|nr:Uncharacterised protein [Kluyvera cryocrescens]